MLRIAAISHGQEHTLNTSVYSPSPECPARKGGDEWRGEPSEALAPVLRRSLLRRMERRAKGYGECRRPYKNAPRGSAGNFTVQSLQFYPCNRSIEIRRRYPSPKSIQWGRRGGVVKYLFTLPLIPSHLGRRSLIWDSLQLAAGRFIIYL